MSKSVYYGKFGEYGPYTPREYGLPDAGEVLAEYRCLKSMSVQDFVEAYNREVAEYNEKKKQKKPSRKLPTITRNLVYKWERHNMVPTDPERRRLIAKFLDIPLALFGIVAAEELIFKPAPQAAPATITHQDIDPLPYEEMARTLWRFHDTSTAQHEWYAIIKSIKDLEAYEQQFRGNLQRNVREALYSYYLLATRVVREDRRDFIASYTFANNALLVAKRLQNDARNSAERTEMGWYVARAQYARGYVQLAWGLYSTKDKQGLFVVDHTKIQNAIADFKEAEKQTAPGLRGNLYAELARAQSFNRKSNTDTTLALRTIEESEKWVGIVSTEDPYAQTLLDGAVGGLTRGAYHLWAAVTLDALGRPTDAVQKLQELENLKVGRIPSDYTRNTAWMNIVWSQAAFGMNDFYTTTSKAKNALFACQDIRSSENIAIIQDIYGQLLTTSYRNEYDVKDLGRLLAVQQ